MISSKMIHYEYKVNIFLSLLNPLTVDKQKIPYVERIKNLRKNYRIPLNKVCLKSHG